MAAVLASSSLGRQPLLRRLALGTAPISAGDRSRHLLGARARAKRPFVVHTADLAPADLARRDGIPVTSLARTILDLAVDSRERTVRRFIRAADDDKNFDLRAMEDLLERTKGHRGQAKVRAALQIYDETPVFTRSDLERRFLEVVPAAGLPAPAMNCFVAGYEIDAYWEDAPLRGRTRRLRDARLAALLRGGPGTGRRAAARRDRDHAGHRAAARPRTGRGGRVAPSPPRRSAPRAPLE